MNNVDGSYLSCGLFDCTYKNSITKSTKLYETHCHNSFELILTLSGNINIIIEGMQYQINKPSAILIHPLQYHSIYTDKSDQYERIIIMFPPEAIPKEIYERIIDKAKNALIQNNAEMVELTKKIKTVLVKDDNKFYSPLVVSYVIEAFYIFSTKQDVEQNKNVNDLGKIITLILEYIETHINEKISLDDIATYVFCSKSTICHVFKEKLKVGIKQYILQKKMAVAEDLIEKGATAASAAQAIGYTNYANFFTMYKKITNKSPSKVKQSTNNSTPPR